MSSGKLGAGIVRISVRTEGCSGDEGEILEGFSTIDEVLKGRAI
jgi:hypothetical protein